MSRSGHLAVCRSGQTQPSKDPFSRFTAFSIGDIEQAGDPSDQAGLVVVKLTIGIGNLPQHFNKGDPLYLVETILDRSGKALPFNAVAAGFFTCCQQCLGLVRGECKIVLEQGFDPGALDIIEGAIQTCRFDHECCRSQLLLFEAMGRFFAGGSGVITDQAL